MELTLYTETVIDSCHQLEGYCGKCSQLHGHTWKISIWIKGDESQKDDVGILFDFGNVKDIKERYDHKLLNEVPPFGIQNKLEYLNPTAENISRAIYEELKHKREELKFKVRVYETVVGKETYCELGDF